MKVYFTASVVGKRHYRANYQKIIDHLVKRGHKVTSDHIMQTTEDRLSKITKEERLAFHENLEQWINTCDFVLVEASFPSISVGYEVSLALNRGKPVLMLYAEDSEAPSLLAHFKEEHFLCESYNSDTVTGIIDDFVNYVHGAADTRFTFFITPAIAAFLERISRKEKTPKSVYLRRLIKEDMAARAEK